MKKYLLFFAIAFLFTGLRAQNAGELDPSFGENGVTSFAPTNSYDKPKALMVQPDGKIITVSEARVNNDSYHIVISRHNTNGNIDTSFGVEGMVIIHPFDGWKDNNPMDAMLLDNGKILIAGYLFDIYATSSPFLVQLNADGSFDEEFGIDGCRIYEFGHTAIVRSMDIQNDGKILLVGQGQAPSDRTIIMRCMPNGNLDSSFGTEGVVAIDIPGTFLADSDGGDVSALEDGKILVVSHAANAELEGQRKSVLFRLNADGSLDTSFGDAGTRWFFIGEGPDFMLDLQLVNNKIYVSGHVWMGQPPTSEQLWYDYAIARVNMDGSIDESYGNNGFATVNIKKKGNYHADFVVSNNETSFGLIDYEGTEAGEYMSRIGLFCLDANGNLNQDFGDAGIAVMGAEGMEYKASEIVFTNDSALIISGKLGNLDGTDTDPLLARYISGIDYDAINEYNSTVNNLSIYPNPTTNSINISTQNNNALYDVTIYSISGSMVMQGKVTSGNSIQVENLQSGNYIVELKSDSENLISRFVKQ